MGELKSQEQVRIFTMRGYAWLREEEPIAAISDFPRAIDIDPDNVSALKGRARSYVGTASSA